MQAVGCAEDVVTFRARLHVVGASINGRFHDFVFAAHFGLIVDLADALEGIGDTARLTQAAVVLAKDGAQFAGGAVAVVG